MGNCLVTTLNATVNNDNLPKLGCFTVKKISAQESFNANYYLAIRTNGMGVATSRDSVFLDDSGNSLGNQISIPNQNYDYYIRIGLPVGVFDIPKNIITRFITSFAYSQIEIPIASFSNMHNLVYAEPILSGDLSELYGLDSIQTLKFKSGSPLTGDIAHLSKFTTLTELSFINISGIYGKIEELGKLTNILTITFNTAGYDVEGNIEDFVKVQRMNGRSTGEVSMLIYGPLIYFNGTRCYASTPKTLSWTANTITYDGATINA